MAIIKQLFRKTRRSNGEVKEDKLYPVTVSSAVFMSNYRTTVEDAIGDLQEGDTTIEFLADGSIKSTLQSGNVITTTFERDGSIKDTCVDKDDKAVYVKTTTFNADGSISIKLDYQE